MNCNQIIAEKFVKILLLFSMTGILSCNYEPKKNNTPEVMIQKKDSVLKKPPGSFSDTLVVSAPSAVFFSPDSLQMKKIKEMLSQNEFKSEEHNCFYLMRNARMVLKKYWSTIHIAEISSYRYLLFVKSDHQKKYIDLDKIGDTCGIFLFDGKKEPELADMMNIDTALRFYFSK